MGEYDKGKRIGTWNVYRRNVHSWADSLVFIEKVYSKGILMSEIDKNQLGQIRKSNTLADRIKGEWFNIGAPREYLYSCCNNGGSCQLVFSRDSLKLRPSYAEILDYINLNQDKSFSLKSSTSKCRQGESWLGNQFDRIKKWYFDKEGKLILDGYIYEITFLSEENMILEFRCK
jgi:hypothetical protein